MLIKKKTKELKASAPCQENIANAEAERQFQNKSLAMYIVMVKEK
ncbi:hypothetical protein [Pedobacter sp. HDW13]|nr:hypothetical protein [Pedobacter sp. HDW13]